MQIDAVKRLDVTNIIMKRNIPYYEIGIPLLIYHFCVCYVGVEFALLEYDCDSFLLKA